MKKNIAALICVFSVLSAIAQDGDTELRKFRFGLGFSPSLNWIKPAPNIDGFEKEKMGIGLAYGLMTELNFSSSYSFSSGINASQYVVTANYAEDIVPTVIVATNDTVINPAEDVSYKYKAAYLEIPVMLKMRTKEIGYFTYFMQFGGSIGVNAKLGVNSAGIADIDYVEENNSDKTGEDIASELGLFRIAGQFGAGAEFNISGNTSAVASINFQPGFTNLFKGGKNAPKTIVLDKDTNGGLQYDTDGNVLYTDGDEKEANVSAVALHIGIFF